MRLFWADAAWNLLAEAVAESATLTLRLNDAGAGSVRVTKQPPTETAGLVAFLPDGSEAWRGRIVSFSGQTAQDTIEVRLVDLAGLLAGYLAWPEPGGDFALQEYDTFSGSATSATLHYVDANAGPAALAWRHLGITLAPDPGLGETVRANARFDNLLSLLREIANLGGVRFRFEGTEFVADQGVQVNDIIFAEHAGTAEDIQWEYAAPEATAVVAGGAGQGTARAFAVQYAPPDLGRWGYWERFWDVRNISDATELATLAQQWLAARKSGYAATITPAIPIRPDIRPGDFIRVWVDGDERRMVVHAVAYRLDGWSISAAESTNIRTPDVVDLGLEGLKRRVELLSTK